MFGFLKTLISRLQPASEKQGHPPAVNRHGVALAAISGGSQQAIVDNNLVDKLEPAPDKHLMTLVGSKTEIEMVAWKEHGKYGTAQDLETPKWMGKETPAPEPEVSAAGSADIERSSKAFELTVDETTAVTSPTSKPKSPRKATKKTAVGSADVERSSKASELSLDKTTVFTSPAATPKSVRTATRNTAAVKKTVNAGSKKAGVVSETKKKTASPKAGPAKPKTRDKR